MSNSKIVININIFLLFKIDIKYLFYIIMELLIIKLNYVSICKMNIN